MFRCFFFDEMIVPSVYLSVRWKRSTVRAPGIDVNTFMLRRVIDIV